MGVIDEKKALQALAATALALQGKTAIAQTAPQPGALNAQYSLYREQQEGGHRRMRIESPSLWARIPIATKGEFEGSFVFDSMAGASPYYFHTLSAPTIRDTRFGVQGKYTHYLERISIGVGGRFSSEDDYLSRGGILESRIWSEDKNTVVSLGISRDEDEVRSTFTPTLRESKRSLASFVGLSQVLSRQAVLQVNLGYASHDGFLTDPYKTYDNRPRSREEWTVLSTLKYFFPSSRSAMHVTYRGTRDTWLLSSHMVEVSWFQPFAHSFLIAPRLRYYGQRKASFFSNEYPPSDFMTFYSADERLSDFGSVTPGVTLSWNTPFGVTAQLSGDIIRTLRRLSPTADSQRGDAVGLSAYNISVGIVKYF